MTGPALLPDGRQVVLGPDVRQVLSCGLLVPESVRIGESAGLSAEIESCAAELRQRYAAKLPSEIDTLREARRLYRSVGMDPTRHRPSSEALLRRVLKGQSLYTIHNAVDACNLASLSFLLPIGLYDLDEVTGDVTLRLGRAGEEYPGIRKGVVHLAGRLGLFDREGPFGSPTSDSARTCVSEKSRRLLAVIMATTSYPADAMERNLALMADLYRRHCDATISHCAILTGES